MDVLYLNLKMDNEKYFIIIAFIIYKLLLTVMMSLNL